MRGTTAERTRHKEILAAVVKQYAGARSLRYMATEASRQLGEACTITTIQHAIWTRHAGPTRHQQWMTAHQAAKLLGCTPQWVSHLCRTGKIAAHRNPSTTYGRGCWLILGKVLESYCYRRGSVVAGIEGDYYVTPHAVRRFIERVAPDLAFDAAKQILIAALKTPWPKTPLPRHKSGAPNLGYMLHVNYQDNGRRYMCRVPVDYSACNAVQFLPSVVTVL